MYRWIIIALALCSAALPASAEARKVALILANSDYANTSSLPNPVNDGMLVADAAKRIGFDTITLHTDLPLDDFRQALRQFRDSARGADVAMVYFAGHGIEGRGKNWLIPVDAKLKADADLSYEAIDLNLVLEATAGAQMRMVVLDACRDNPFANGWSAATRSVSRGLARIEVDDVLIVYAAAPGQVAYDGAEGNSPFAASLARRITQPGLPVQMLGGMVRDDVLAVTDGAQRPYISASVTGRPVYLVAPSDDAARIFAALLEEEENRENAANSVSRPAAEVQVGRNITDGAADALAWKGALTADILPAYRAYLADWPQGQFTALANANIARLLDPTLAGPTQQSAKRSLISVDGFLPYRDAVMPGASSPIDGLWTVSTINKRIRIERGRAFAVDAWNHAVVLRVKQNMVVWTDMTRTGPGRYEASDLPLQGRARATLRPDGNIDVVVGTGLFPARYRLIKQGVDDPDAFAEEQRAVAGE